LHQKFGDIINDNGLAQIVQKPTRQRNVLDLIVTNKPNQLDRVQILPGIGDHNAVFCDFDVSPSRRKLAPRRIALFNKADWSSFRMFVSNLGEEITRADSRSANSETLWQMFKDKIDKGVQLFKCSFHLK